MLTSRAGSPGSASGAEDFPQTPPVLSTLQKDHRYRIRPHRRLVLYRPPSPWSTLTSFLKVTGFTGFTLGLLATLQYQNQLPMADVVGGVFDPDWPEAAEARKRDNGVPKVFGSIFNLKN